MEVEVKLKVEVKKLPFLLMARCLICSAPVVEELVIGLKDSTAHIVIASCQEHDERALQTVVRTTKALRKKAETSAEGQD